MGSVERTDRSRSDGVGAGEAWELYDGGNSVRRRAKGCSVTIGSKGDMGISYELVAAIPAKATYMRIQYGQAAQVLLLTPLAEYEPQSLRIQRSKRLRGSQFRLASGSGIRNWGLCRDRAIRYRAAWERGSILVMLAEPLDEDDRTLPAEPSAPPAEETSGETPAVEAVDKTPPQREGVIGAATDVKKHTCENCLHWNRGGYCHNAEAASYGLQVGAANRCSAWESLVTLGPVSEEILCSVCEGRVPVVRRGRWRCAMVHDDPDTGKRCSGGLKRGKEI